MTDRPAPPEPVEPDDAAIELASRYLDGDLAADERAAAEADPLVMTWVDRFGGVRAALQAPIEIDATRRDAAIAAALAASDEATVDERPLSVVRAPVVDDLAVARARRNHRLTKWVGAAAAVVALGVAGVAIAGSRDSGGGGSDAALEARATTVASSDESLASTASKEFATTGADEDVAAGAAATPAADSADQATAAPSPASAAAGSTETTAAPAGAPATTIVAAETTAAGGATEAPTTTAAGDPDVPVTIDGLASLQAYAVGAADAPADATAPCRTTTEERLLSRNVHYDGAEAVVYRSVSERTVTAYDLESCAVLASAQLPGG